MLRNNIRNVVIAGVILCLNGFWLAIINAAEEVQTAPSAAQLAYRPSMTSILNSALEQTDRVVIRSGGTSMRNPLLEEKLAVITDSAEIKELLALMAVAEDAMPEICQCPGNPSIEFYRGEKLLGTVGIHHGVAIRFPEYWQTDGFLINPEGFVEFLHRRGVVRPLQVYRNKLRNEKAFAEAWTDWITSIPEGLRPYTNEIASGMYTPEMDKKLRTRYLNLKPRLLMLFDWYGKGEMLWSASMPQETAPYALLSQYKITSLDRALLSRELKKEEIAGAAFFFSHADFISTRNKELKLLDPIILEKMYNYGLTLESDVLRNRIIFAFHDLVHPEDNSPLPQE